MEVFSWVVIIAVSWVTLLAGNISRIRIKEIVGTGDCGKLPLKKAIRAHINVLEYSIPFFLIMFVLSSNGTTEFTLTAIASLFFTSRFLHALSYYVSSDVIRQGRA
ncbi:MAPEG family protein [Pseudomonas sp. HK3]